MARMPRPEQALPDELRDIRHIRYLTSETTCCAGGNAILVYRLIRFGAS